MQFEVASEYGWVLAAALAMYLEQNLVFVAGVFLKRKSTGIKAPTLYPRDSEIKALKLSQEQVDAYNRAQRVHQNNMEFMSFFLPLFLVAGLHDTHNVAIAGAVVVVFRMLGAIGYWSSAKSRSYGALFHVGELYVLYSFGSLAASLIASSS